MTIVIIGVIGLLNMSRIVDPILLTFISENSIEKRHALIQQINTLHPNRIPVLVGRGELKVTPSIKKYKFLVPVESIFGKFLKDVKNNISDVESYKTIIFFVGDIIPTASASMQQLYDKYKREDGFLYVTYVCENTFGC